jgi:N-hydroxyarylamine O-acetyltransferase
LPDRFDLSAYLERIGRPAATPEAAGLRALQQAHMRAIPFENFDPLLDKVPDLAPEAIFDKIVRRRRGGYCFEQNGLYGAALAAIGFAPRRLLARVRMRFGSEAARSHLILAVEIEGRSFLTDVGFGGPGPLTPLELGVEGKQEAPNGTFRISDDPERGETVVERQSEDGWLQLYAFDRARVTDGEIDSANYFCATWDQAPFGFHVVVGGYAGGLRYGLFDRQLSVSGPEGTEQRQLSSLEDFADVVTGKLGIALDSAALERAWAKSGGA